MSVEAPDVLQGLYHTPLSIDIHMVSLGRGDVCLGHRWCLVPFKVGDTQSYTTGSRPPFPIRQEPKVPPGWNQGPWVAQPGWERHDTVPSLASGLWMWGVGRLLEAKAETMRAGQLGDVTGPQVRDRGHQVGSGLRRGFSVWHPCSSWPST